MRSMGFRTMAPLRPPVFCQTGWAISTAPRKPAVRRAARAATARSSSCHRREIRGRKRLYGQSHARRVRPRIRTCSRPRKFLVGKRSCSSLSSPREGGNRTDICLSMQAATCSARQIRAPKRTAAAATRSSSNPKPVAGSGLISDEGAGVDRGGPKPVGYKMIIC